MQAPNQFLKQPTSDFPSVRDGRASLPLYIDIDLSSARSISANTALVLNLAANSFYVDADTSFVGNATVHFQDTNLGNASAPIFVSPGFIARVPFTQILIENVAQAGKKLRVFYGVDIDFQAGVNTSSTVINASSVRKAFVQGTTTVGTVWQTLTGANPTRDYLLIQNNHPSANLWVDVTGTVPSVGVGVRIPGGGSYELSSTCPTGGVLAISDTVGTQVTVVTG